MSCVLPLASTAAILPIVGGKGASLARLAAAHLPVPEGFHITTDAYTAFVAANDLQNGIAAALAATDPGRPETLETAAATIGDAFRQAAIPGAIRLAVIAAYQTLGSGQIAVAVRSSATAEDLPDLSFAGQQDTFLNVIGQESLLCAVMDCWASLWTARAIGYRLRNHVPVDGLSLAVVVQEMVDSEVSGVLFTADPLTGHRRHTVIDATLGLGEALVSGRVEPDHYAVDMDQGAIMQKRLGSKAISIRPQKGGGTATWPEQAAGEQALPDAQILELAGFGERIAGLYGTPQDIEWAWAGGRIFILQSRPITSLYPLLEGLPSQPLQVCLSFAAVQGVLDPITPCGRDVFKSFSAYASHLFRYQYNFKTQRALAEAGERIFINVSPLMRTAVSRRLVRAAPAIGEPGIGQALANIWNDPELVPTRQRPSIGTIRRLLPVALPLAARGVFALWRPAFMRQRAQNRAETLVARFTADMDSAVSLIDRLDVVEQMLALPHTVFSHLLPCLVPGMAMMNLLFRLAAEAGVDRQVVLEITRGLPQNVTTEMDLALWRVAQEIRSDPEACLVFQSASVDALCQDFLQGCLPATIQRSLADFMKLYGVHGTAEIDVGRPRWSDDPAPVLHSLRSYLQIEDPEAAPDRIFARGAASASEAVARLAARVREGPGGRFRAQLTRFAAGRMRALAGIREYPKFFAVRLLGLVRAGLLASGRDLVADGLLIRPDDVFFLRLDELRELGNHLPRDWRRVVEERRAVYERERRRTLIPRVLLSDGRAYYGGLSAPESDGQTLVGSPVSPGTVEGPVRVVLDPHSTPLEPGDILVCPGTDPAWTPLFLAAGGLVMEVGGLMTHGAVVAREYGIPAIASVHEATTRLKTGQRIRVDGSEGRITVL